MYQGIAYTGSNGTPVVTWPGCWIDEDGNERSCLEQVIASLPEGTEYTLVTEEEAEHWLAEHRTMEERQAIFFTAVQAHLDDFARTRHYDGILAAASYATSTDERYRAEGQYAVDARDATWRAAHAVMAGIAKGTRTMPTPEACMAKLPKLQWPE